MVWFIIGMIAALCSTVGFIPQIIRGIKTKSLSDVSPATVLITMTASSLWLVYGIHLKNPIIISSNIAIVLLTNTILILRFLFKPEAAALKRKILSLSIRYRIILLLVAFVLMPFLLSGIIAYPQIQADIQRVLIRNFDNITYKQAELITNWIHEKIKNAYVIANYPIIAKYIEGTKESKDYFDVVQYLEAVKSEYGYKGMLVSDDKGLVIIATNGEVLGSNILKSHYLHEVIHGDAFVSEIFPSEIPLMNEYREEELGMPVLFISIPLKDKAGKMIGSVSLRIDALKLSDLVHNLILGKTGEAYLVNRDGYMITESKFAEHLKGVGLIKKRCGLELRVINRETVKLTDGVQQCISGNNGFDANGYKNYRDIIVLGAWRWLPKFNFGIMVEIDKNEGYGVAYNLNYMVTAVLLILVFPFVLVAYFAGRKLSTPIIELTEVTKKMVSGDLTQRVNIQREDEIGELANSFNAMVKSFDEKTKKTTISEKRCREMFHSIKEGVYQSEPGVEGVITFINKAGAEILGYASPEEVIGMMVKNIYVNPEDWRRLCEKLEKGEVRREFVSLCKRKNGENFYTERTSSLLKDKQGNTIAIYGVFRDITERKKSEIHLQESERHYRQLLNSSKEGIYQCESTEDGVFTWINQAGAEMLGYNSPSEVVGTRVKDIYVNPDDRKELIKKLEKEGVWRDFTSYYKRKNGERFTSEMYCILVPDKSGKLKRIYCKFIV
jgi:PAS domain S-box-containing protein